MPTAPEPRYPAEGRLPPSIALTIAGFDPSCGAGITADLKVFAAHGIYGVAAITALTVQSTRGVNRVEPMASILLAQTLASLAEDLPPAGIKIGMLATAANVEAVASFLEAHAADRMPVVLDPVLQSSSGHPLLAADGLDWLRGRLLPLVTCVTPNFQELALLSGCEIDLEGERVAARVEAAVSTLAGTLPALAVVATGGDSEAPNDYVKPGGAAQGDWLRGQRVDTRATHGTGCAYSSALLCGLIGGATLLEAAASAKRYVTEALAAATPMGSGGGAMHHLYRFQPAPHPKDVTRKQGSAAQG